MGESLYDFCIREERQELLRQWMKAENLPLTPEGVSRGSRRYVWWRCEKGHKWRAQVKSRAYGSGCPICTNRVISPEENSLAAWYPQLAAQWHPDKNGGLTPAQVAPGTRRKVWWRCEKGHEWRASVTSRVTGGSGCPVCSGKQVLPGENDLASLFPGLAAEWDAEKNGRLTPGHVTPGSNRRVWWLCGRGHSYQAAIGARTSSGSGCPYCAGRRVLAGFNDLATLYPGLARQWHPELNGALTPEMVTAGSHKKVWWECGEGHIWRAAVYARTGPKRSGCPVCAGRRQ